MFDEYYPDKRVLALNTFKIILVCVDISRKYILKFYQPIIK